MAVVGVAQELPTGQGGGLTASVTSVSARHTRVFRVVVSSPRDDDKIVLAAPGLPMVFSPYSSASSSDISTLATEFQAVRVAGTRLAWDVTVGYTHFTSDDKERETVEPFSRRPRIAIDSESVMEPVYGAGALFDEQKAVTLRPAIGVTTSGGEVFVPPAMEPRYRSISTWTFAAPGFNTGLAREFTGAVNSVDFYGAKERTALLRRYATPGLTVWNGPNNQEVEYFPVTAVIAYDERTWDLEILDYGSWYFSGAVGTSEKHLFTDEAGNPTLGKLDGEGKKLDAGKEDEFRRFRVKLERPFLNLQLPDPSLAGF